MPLSDSDSIYSLASATVYLITLGMSFLLPEIYLELRLSDICSANENYYFLRIIISLFFSVASIHWDSSLLSAEFPLYDQFDNVP